MGAGLGGEDLKRDFTPPRSFSRWRIKVGGRGTWVAELCGSKESDKEGEGGFQFME